MDCSKHFPVVDLSSSLSTSSASSNNRNSLCSSPVVELQSGNLSEREIRNAGIHPTTSQMSADTGSSSSSSTVSLGKLKEPRDLYSTATLLHPIKWPVECQVIPEKIRHMSATPPKMESFYNPTGKETQPQPVGIEMGTVVYDYQPKLSVDYFCRATIGGSQDLEQFVTNNIEPTTLRFESRFESGNLAKAMKVTNTYYELYLRPDLYTDRHAQWFYFRIQNTKENVQYRFSIVNFNKPDSLYRYGLKILMYSEKEAQLNNVGWTRCGQNIAYFKNDISPDDNGPYYTLTFNLKFRHNNDTVYLSQCYPYTYSTLQNYLKSIEDDEFKSQLLTIRLLCRSLAGNNVHVLTVTSPTNSSSAPDDKTHIAPCVTTAQDEENPENSKKPVIVISARVHPGESQSSYMMKGIIDFLTSDSSQAKELRDRFIFKLIPMLNPDGVIVGNTRCCLLGQDLNRQYRTVLREAFPQIYHAKVMLRRLQEENGIFLYCDLHGHSRKHNVFIYGCENRKMPEKRLVEQVFPLMMHKNAADKFSFQSCKFKIQKNKEGTGRIFAWTLGIVNSYTLEISLGGSTMPSRQYTHFTTADYEACGRHFCETLLDYSDPNPTKETLRERILQKLVDGGSTADEPKNVVLSDYSSLSHSETDGEDGEDGDEDSGDDGNNSFSTKSSSGFGSATTPNSSAKQQLKRQMSFRKHHQSQQSSSSSQNNRVKSAGKQSVKNETRSPLFIHKATVDFTKIKHRKLDEPVAATTISSVGATNPAPEEKDLTTLAGDSIKEILPATGRDSREISAAFRRLTKFRRKSRRNNNVQGDQLDHHQYQLTAKCTSILFDDPFNPPGTRLNRTDREYYHHKRTSRCRDNLEAIDVNSAWQSGTEDECDPYDMTIKTPAPSIKVIDCGGAGGSESGVSNEDFAQALTVDMSKLAVSNNQRSSSDSETGSHLPSFSPFTPSFPVGKTFLHQTCYPDKGNSPKRNRNAKEGESKLKNSLSDTTIAITSSALGPSIFPSATQPKPTVARRSSLTYLSTGKINKLQTTASSAAGAGQTVASSRRRVSWTGSLTVSVPNVPMSALCNAPGGVLRSPLMHSQHRKKSFRKCKSLNDKSTQQQPQNSSSELNDSSASLGTSASMDKISLGSSSSQVIGNSHSTGNIASTNTILPSTSSLGAKKRRAKLKRSKHK